MSLPAPPPRGVDSVFVTARALAPSALAGWLAARLPDGAALAHFKGFGAAIAAFAHPDRSTPPAAPGPPRALLAALRACAVVAFDGDDLDGRTFTAAVPPLLLLASATSPAPALLAFKRASDEARFARSWHRRRLWRLGGEAGAGAVAGAGAGAGEGAGSGSGAGAVAEASASGGHPDDDVAWGSDTLAPDAEPPGGSVRVEIAYVLVPDAAFAPGFCGGVLHDAQAGAALAPADRASLLARACREAWGDAAPAVPAPEADDDAEAEAARREVFDPGPSAALRVGEGQEGYVALGTLAALLTTALAPRGTPARCLVWGGLAVVARELAAESALMLPSLRARLPWTYWHAARVRRGAREEGLLLGRAHEALTHADAAADALCSQAWRACTARLEAAEATTSQQGSAAFATL
jgi:hypothetical protein